MNARERELIKAKAMYTNPYAFIYRGYTDELGIEHTALETSIRLSLYRTGRTHCIRPKWIIAEAESIMLARLKGAEISNIQTIFQLEQLVLECIKFYPGRKREVTFGYVADVACNGVTSMVVTDDENTYSVLYCTTLIPDSIKEILDIPLCMF